jgi:hypothetical protein
VLRAGRNGRVFFGRPQALAGFERAPGSEYAWACPYAVPPTSLVESDTGRVLRSMATFHDVAHLAGTWAWDKERKRICVHPSDSAEAGLHVYQPVTPGEGLKLADYTVVDGLVMTGFGHAAIQARNATGVVVQNCVLHGNGYAIHLIGGRDCVIRGNEAWNNRPAYNEGAQIHVTGDPPGEGILVENNVAYGGRQYGIRFYSGKAKDCVARGNLTYDNALGGFFYKMNSSENLVGERNVCVGNANNDFSAPTQRHNTFGQQARDATDATDLRLGGKDWRFADEAWRDYRLQSDSPARGAAPDGSDLGAFAYDGSVVYVAPDGDDAAEGSCAARPWRTLAHAAKALRPGQTLYLAAGEWKEPLALKGLKAGEDRPTQVRVRGRGTARLPAVMAVGCANLALDGLRVRGNDGNGFTVDGSEGVRLSRCAGVGNRGDGVGVTASRNVVIENCALAGNRKGLQVERSQAVALVGSILAGNSEVQVALEASADAFYGNFNAFLSADKTLGAAGAGRAADLEAWRRMTGGDADSVAVGPATFADVAAGDFRVRAGSHAAFAGLYGRPVGPDGVFVGEYVTHRPVERVEVLSTTRTSANITYWTPGRVTGTLIEWGKDARYGSLHDRGAEPISEYETFHTVSLIGLEPNTAYHFRVGYRDFEAAANEKVDGKDPVFWSEDMTFKTAVEDPLPRRLFVSLDGDDGRDGRSPATAWRSLAKASREARCGDTVTLAPGRYVELLRPLQTGTGEDRRVTFRAEQPLTVFLDGGFAKFQRDGRSHCIQVQSKACVTIENLVCEKVREHDNGGYRGGIGYAGLIGISGSAGIEIKGCVMDGRARWMPCMWVFEAGKMPGAPDDLPGFTVSDSVLYYGWRLLGFQATRRCILRNNALVRGLTGMVTVIGGTPPKTLVLRNNTVQSLILAKAGNPIFSVPAVFDSDFNCFGWDTENTRRVIANAGSREEPRPVSGLAEWQKTFGLDANSLEAEPGYPLSMKAGFGNKGEVDMQTPLTVKDMLLPPDSPCRGKGEKGEDIGPRWQRFAGQ